jgi:hypothetical protein
MLHCRSDIDAELSLCVACSDLWSLTYNTYKYLYQRSTNVDVARRSECPMFPLANAPRNTNLTFNSLITITYRLFALVASLLRMSEVRTSENSPCLYVLPKCVSPYTHPIIIICHMLTSTASLFVSIDTSTAGTSIAAPNWTMGRQACATAAPS